MDTRWRVVVEIAADQLKDEGRQEECLWISLI